MKTIEILWKHLDVNGKTCDRCHRTGDEIRQFVDRLHEECLGKDVRIALREVKLTENEIEESNRIFINGIPIEDFLPDAGVSQNDCLSCTDLLGSSTRCRTIIHSGREYETIPQELIREAVCKIAQCC